MKNVKEQTGALFEGIMEQMKVVGERKMENENVSGNIIVTKEKIKAAWGDGDFIAISEKLLGQLAKDEELKKSGAAWSVLSWFLSIMSYHNIPKIISISNISDQLQLTRKTVSSAIILLESKGLIYLFKVGKDRRTYEMRINAKFAYKGKLIERIKTIKHEKDIQLKFNFQA